MDTVESTEKPGDDHSGQWPLPIQLDPSLSLHSTPMESQQCGPHSPPPLRYSPPDPRHFVSQHFLSHHPVQLPPLSSPIFHHHIPFYDQQNTALPHPTSASHELALTQPLPTSPFHSDPYEPISSPNSHHRPSSSPSSTTPSPNAVVPRLPPILQVEKPVVTTSATQAASASRRTNAASFQCPVPSCSSTFTRRFNLRGHLRSHTEEKPYICEWPECGKGFARQHDCKRHQALHTKPQGAHPCATCGRSFSRLDALNRHLRSEGGSGCKKNRARNATIVLENTNLSASPPPGERTPPLDERPDDRMDDDD